MSLRAVKKLKQNANTNETQEQEQEQEQNKLKEDPQSKNTATKIINYFGSFEDNNSDESDTEVVLNDQEETIKSAKQPEKKKKNKKKSKKKDTKNQIQQNKEDDEDLIILSQLQKEQTNLEETKGEESKDQINCLELDAKKFNYNKELSRYFKNAKLIESGSEEFKNKKELARIKAFKNSKHLKNQKQFILVHNETGFFTNPDRFSMELVGSNEFKYRIFSLKPSSKYEALQVKSFMLRLI